MAHTRREHQERKLRLMAKPGLYSCAVRYSMNDEIQTPRWAQYADISESGMKIISTKPHKTEVGSILELKFSLAGGQHEVIKKARVVRSINEFAVGLQFLNPKDDFKTVFHRHTQFTKDLPWRMPLNQFRSWWKEHKIGLRIAITGVVFFTLTSSIIYFFSDDFNGRKRSWGQTYSNSIDFEYVQHFNHSNKKH